MHSSVALEFTAETLTLWFVSGLFGSWSVMTQQETHSACTERENRKKEGVYNHFTIQVTGMLQKTDRILTPVSSSKAS